MARLGPSGLAQLFREIANYVSTRLSDYKTKAELDSLLDTKADDNNVIHKSGDETIDGTKTFISGPWVTNNHTATGYSIKNTALARNDIPTEYQHYTFRAYDKNNKIMGEYCIEKATTGDALLSMNVRSEDSSGTQISYGMQFRMTNDGSLVRFMPSANNKVHLGDPNAKWLKVHSDDVVHTSGNETITGSKTFIDTIKSNLNFYNTSDVLDVEIPYIAIGERTNGVYKPSVNWKDKDGYILGGVSVGRTYSQDTTASLSATTKKSDGTLVYPEVKVIAKSDGISYATAPTPSSDATGNEIVTAEWVNALDGNLVHKSGDETINGNKIFSNTIHRYADLTTSTVEQVYRFDDSNANACGHIYNNVHWHNNAVYNRHGAYNAKSGKVMEIDIISNDSGVGMAYISGTATKGNLETVTSETGHTSIATMGWVNNPATSTNVVHRSGNEYIGGTKTFSSKIVGNLQGNADTATSFASVSRTSNLKKYSLPSVNKIYLDWDVQEKGYVGLKVDETEMGGILTTKNIGSQGYLTLTSLAGGNSAGSLSHSVGSLVLAHCSSTAFASTKCYATVAGQQLYPCRTEIFTSYSQGFTSIVVLGNDSSLGSGTWRYLGGANAAFNDAAGIVYGMFLRVA